MINLILLILVVLILLPMAIAWKNFAPWVPTREADLERIFELANLKEGQVFYDIGSGTGKMVFYASKNYKVRSIGLELALPLFLLSKTKSFFNKNELVKIKWQDLYKENLSEADVVYCFGVAETLNYNFQKKLEKEIKPGAKVISYAFKVGDLKPTHVNKPSDKHLPIYVYQF